MLPTPIIGAAFLLNFTSLLQLFAQCNRYADARDAEFVLESYRAKNQLRQQVDVIDAERYTPVAKEYPIAIVRQQTGIVNV